ncbi:VOC family protein [Rubrivirga sp. IMCC43871]|uniref:VOC family protein n=1 Tax=Rubrivirga sp. IMCC43871 TaxID=3391575 RepID=UPI00399036F8
MRSLVFALAVLAAGCASTAPSAPVALDHSAVHVADLDASVAFYQSLFGLAEKPTPGDPAVIRWLDLGTAELHLIAYDGDVPTTDKAVHFAFRVRDFDAIVARAEALGIAYSDWPGAPATISVRGDGIRQIYVQDPDGYWIEVNDVRG